MLILQRKLNESIDVVTQGADAVEITVVAIRGDKVRLGFRAAGSTTIHRREVTLAIAAEKQEVGAA